MFAAIWLAVRVSRSRAIHGAPMAGGRSSAQAFHGLRGKLNPGQRGLVCSHVLRGGIVTPGGGGVRAQARPWPPRGLGERRRCAGSLAVPGGAPPRRLGWDGGRPEDGG
jgi:hypothetical protein